MNKSKVVNLDKAVDGELLIERLFTVRADSLEENADRSVNVVFSTEYQYTQWFGREVLSHDTGAMDLSRIDNQTAPVLLNHNRNEQIGVIDSARMVNRQGIATLRFSRNKLGDEVYKDILDGIRSQISCGYRIFKWEVDETDPNDPLYTITQWQPYEISVCTLNADPASLVQRGYFTADSEDTERQYPAGEPAKENKAMADEVRNDDEGKDEQTPYVAGFEIFERGKTENEPALAMEIIGKKGTLEDFEHALRDKRAALAKESADADTDAERESALESRFKLSDLIFQTLNPGAERGQRELEEAKDLTSDAEKRGHITRGGLLIPHSRLDGVDEAQRDLTTAAASGGGLISDDVRGDLFIEALRNNMVMGDLVTMVTGLRGNVSIPVETTAATAAWKAENTANTESDPVIGQVELTPKFVRGFTEVSRTLIAQSSADVEAIVRRALMKGVAVVVDKGILTGTGTSNEPSGVDSISSLAEVEYGLAADTAAAALAKADIDDLTAMEASLDTANAGMDRRAFIVAPNVRQHYRTQPIVTGAQPAWYNQRLLDEPAYVTNQVSAGEAYFGNWSDCYVGVWDAIEVLVNPYSGDTTGLVRITAWQMADVGFGHGGSFVKLLKTT